MLQKKLPSFIRPTRIDQLPFFGDQRAIVRASDSKPKRNPGATSTFIILGSRQRFAVSRQLYPRQHRTPGK